MGPHRVDRQQRTVTLALRRAELTTEELWIRYFGMGGEAGMSEIEAYLHGQGELNPLNRTSSPTWSTSASTS